MGASEAGNSGSEAGAAVRWEKDGRVALVWLCNPGRRNAMGPPFWEGLPRVMTEVAADPEVAAVALLAEGDHYTVGLDLKTMMGTLQGRGAGEIPRRQALIDEIRRLQEAITSVAACPVPVVTALHGYCIGGGVDLASACDVRLASEDLLLSVREVKLAIVADVGSLQRLPGIIGKGHTRELAYTGKDIGAERCVQIGLVNSIHGDADGARAAARAMAAEMAANSPLALRGIKQVLRYSEEHGERDGLEYVALYNSAFLFSEDLAEAVQAFVQKRPPRFTGR